MARSCAALSMSGMMRPNQVNRLMQRGEVLKVVPLLVQSEIALQLHLM